MAVIIDLPQPWLISVVPKEKANKTIENDTIEWKAFGPTKCISRIDNEKEDTHAKSMPDGCFHVDLKRVVDEGIIEAGENGLGTERLGSSDGGNHLFGDATSLSDVLEGKPDIT